MKILLLSKYGDEVKKGIYENLNNISSVYGYFYYHNFLRHIEEKKLDIDLDIMGLNDIDKIIDTYDHCFVLTNRGIKNMDIYSYVSLRKKITNKIFTIAPTSKIVGKEDILLYYTGKVKKKCLKINWTADKYELYPEQKQFKKKTKKIRILIDHEYYGKKNSRIYNGDQTKKITKFLLDYKKTNPKIELIQINSDVKNGYQEINSLDDLGNYNRLKATSFKNIYKIYRSSSIFFVTHEECMGLSTLECNMAGCLVIHPSGYIKKEFSKYLDKIVFDPNKDFNLDMSEIIKNLNYKKTKMKAHKNNFYNAVTKILNYLYK